MLSLSLAQARLLHLSAQGLLNQPKGKATRRKLLAAVERMQLLQIDTIHVVARSPYLVLFSRLGFYPLRWLEDALAAGDLFEGWAHEACFIPTQDYPLNRHSLADRSHHWAIKQARRMYDAHRDSMDRLLEHVRVNGPVKASDFERREKSSSGWWGWKDEKRWLESWFALGELMIAARENFHRVYDVSERVIGRAIADWRTGGLLRPEEIQKRLVLKTVKALGITQARWIADYFRSGKKHQDADLDVLVEGGDLIRVRVQGWERPAYVHRDLLPYAQKAVAGGLRATYTTLLSPFDPVVWDRARARVMFDFDYTLECYTPADKRRYGYFVLPILHRGKLVGRLDAKAHRRDGLFEVKAIYFEPKTKFNDTLLRDVAQAIQYCADWHQAPKVLIRKGELTEPTKALSRILKSAH